MDVIHRGEGIEAAFFRPDQAFCGLFPLLFLLSQADPGGEQHAYLLQSTGANHPGR